jgi:hypothetical protein
MTDIDVQPRWMTRAGWVFTVLPAVLLAFSGAMKLSGAAQVVEGFTAKFGFPASVIVPIGLVELACTALYLAPRTAMLGAVLLAGYLGGATVTHVRIGESPLPAIFVGVVLWGGLFLRDPRLRALLPLRRG